MTTDLHQLIRHALIEDIGHVDVTTACCVDKTLMGCGRILAKSDLVLSGIDLVPVVFDELKSLISYTPHVQMDFFCDNQAILCKNTLIAQIVGPFYILLQAERVLLNLLMHLSGIATLTHQAQTQIKHTKTRVLDTRKTLPGLRYLQKRAVLHGGGLNHRFNLSDGILIKDNHIQACGGSISLAIQRALSSSASHHLHKIECEISHLAQIEEAIAAGAHVLLLDNMNTDTLTQAVAQINGRVKTEASGNMTIARLKEVAETGVDFISMGALTHSAGASDISMKISPH